MAANRDLTMGFARTEKIDRETLGKRLREAREYLGLSQDEVATHLGIPRSALSNIERGQRGVDALELKRLAALYKQPASHFTGENEFTSELPADVAHLARAVSGLSEQDRQELSRFADYLRARSAAERSPDG